MSLLLLLYSMACVWIIAIVLHTECDRSPDAYTHDVHDGEVTVAGWIHCVYATLALWVLALFHFVPAWPPVSHRELYVVSTLLTPFFFIGVAKWNRAWFARLPHNKPALIVFVAGPVVVWTITLLPVNGLINRLVGG